MFYAAFLLLQVSSSGVAIDPDLNAPDFEDFHRRLISDEVNMATPAAKVEYAKVHIVRALRNMRLPRFEDALTQVAAAHAKV